MVGLDTAIKEINEGVIIFDYPQESGCATEGEIAILLKRLKEFEKIELEPEEIKTMKNNGGWIPVSERLPDEPDWESEKPYKYQATVKFNDILDVRDCVFCDKRWSYNAIDMTDNVVAWQPLPDPYRPQEQYISNN